MAEKIELQFTSTANGDGLTQINNGLKQAGRESKTFADVGKSAFQQVVNQIDGPAKDAINGFSSVIGNLAKGGIWGAVASAAGIAISAIVKHFNEAKEKAKELAEKLKTELKESLTAIGDKFKSITKDITNATTAAQSFANVDTSAKVSEIHQQIAKVQTETLQAVVDQTTAEAKEIQKANGQLKIATLKLEEARVTAAAKEEEAQTKVDAAIEKETAAKEQVAAIERTLEGYLARHKEAYQKATDAKNQIALLEEELQDPMSNQRVLLSQLNQQQEKLSQAESEMKDAMGQYNEQSKSVLAPAQQALADAELQTQVSLNELQVVQNQNKDAIALATEAENQAKITKDAAIAAEQAATVKKQEEIARAEEEKAAKEAAQQYQQAYNDVVQQCTEAGLNTGTYLEQLNELIQQGFTPLDAYNALQPELNAAVEARKEAEKQAADEAKKLAEQQKKEREQKEREQKEKEQKEAQDIARVVGEVISKANVKTTTTLAGNPGGQIEQGFGFRDWERQNRQDEREARNIQHKMERDQSMWVKYATGRMGKEEEQRFEKYLGSLPPGVQEKYKDAMRNALKTQLMDKKEQEKAMDKVDKSFKQGWKDKLKDAIMAKDKQEKLAKDLTEMAKEIKEKGGPR